MVRKVRKGKSGGRPFVSAVEEYPEEESRVFSEEEEEILLPRKGIKSDLPRVDLEDSDIEEGEEGNEDDGYDDIRSWGRKKRTFYGGNKVTDRKESDDDEEFEKDEAQESRLMQLKQLEQMDEEDFADMFIPSAASGGSTDKVASDTGNLSDKEKTQFFLRESPEFSGIVADFKEKIAEASEVLYPAIKLMKNGELPDAGLAARIIKIKFDLILNYCTNIYSYLIFKSRRTHLKSHYSLSGRLVQYKHLLNELVPLEKDVMTELKAFLDTLNNGKLTVQDLILRKNESDKTSKPRKKLKIMGGVPGKSLPPVVEEDPPGFEEDEEEDRRAISYQIAKNKGLTPKRSKLQRNPRVKHRVKFEKAKIRRKGQVRTVRKEMKKYSGEISGINARVKKGIKLN